MCCYTESDIPSFDVRTRSLSRHRARTVVRQEEEEVDCNTRIVQEGNSAFCCEETPCFYPVPQMDKMF